MPAVWSPEDRNDVFIAYLIDGKTFRNIDRSVLGADSSDTQGNESRAILQEYGLADPEWRGILSGYSPGEALARLLYAACTGCGHHADAKSAALFVSESVRSGIGSTDMDMTMRIGARKPKMHTCDQQFHSRHTQMDAEPALRSSPVYVPPLRPSGRRREFDQYTISERAEIVRRFLFHGAHHRQLDREVLGLDPAVSKGFQSMGVLHYLGMKQEFRGLFENMAVSDAVRAIRDADNSEQYKEILSIMEEIREKEDHIHEVHDVLKN